MIHTFRILDVSLNFLAKLQNLLESQGYPCKILGFDFLVFEDHNCELCSKRLEITDAHISTGLCDSCWNKEKGSI